MNDCLWLMVWACDCPDGTCDKYLSANGAEGQVIFEQYARDVEEALGPVKQKYLSLFLGGGLHG